MKQRLYILILLLTLSLSALAQHPHLYVSDADRAQVKAKIASQAWADSIYQRLLHKLTPFVERHHEDPQWIVSRLAMYWQEGAHYTQCYLMEGTWHHGEGNAPVPTVRMPGMRTWNRYANVPLEERPPYNTTGDMWGVSTIDPSAPRVLVPYRETGHMIRANNVEILTLAEEAAFLYWLTEKEQYACFASDIFQTWLIGTYYMNPILSADPSSTWKGGYTPGGICGYYDYEQIHDDLALHGAIIYDFAYPYLLAHPHPHLQEIGKGVPEVAGSVFKRFIDIGLIRGGKSGNWNVNGWNMMLLPILALEENDFYPDGKGHSHYLHYLTTESTAYHEAIPDMLKSYDSVTGLWPESPGYSFGTIAMLLEFSTLLKRKGIDLIADNPMIQKAAMAIFPWMDSRCNLIVFGDYRGGMANLDMFEHLLAYYQQAGDSLNMSHVAAALTTGIRNGTYRRENAGWRGLCTYTAALPQARREQSNERSSYSPHHRLITLKSEQAEENLMAVIYGGRKGYHLTPNGLALQLYGFGYALAPDAAGYESYWSKDYRYHQSATGSNTILPGYEEGEIVIKAMEPQVDVGYFTNTRALNPYINFCDVQAGEKRRVVALVKTAAGKGYYVDIFRSDQPDNDYLFHNVGTSLDLYGSDGNPLPLMAIDTIGQMHHEGYRWFSNLSMTTYADNFRAAWTITSGAQPLSMQMWMIGMQGRSLYVMDAPYTTLRQGLTPEHVSMAPATTPTLLVRQQEQNAWTSPFMAVLEPVKGEASVVSVRKIAADRTVAVLCVESSEGRKDYIFSATTPDRAFASGKRQAFQGTFGVITESPDGLEQIYLKEGRCLRNGRYAIEASQPISVSVYRQEGTWYSSSTGKATFHCGKKTYQIEAGYHRPLNN